MPERPEALKHLPHLTGADVLHAGQIRYFHSRISMHFSQYVNWYRVDTATELLRNTKLSITEIATRSGFQSIRSFNRIYRAFTGVSPSEVKK